jgi:hypothetical protein
MTDIRLRISDFRLKPPALGFVELSRRRRFNLQSEIRNLKFVGLMSNSGSPAKRVTVRRFLNQQFKKGSFSSDYGVHASVLRKPEVIAKHPPAWSRFNNPAVRRCGGAFIPATNPRIIL